MSQSRLTDWSNPDSASGVRLAPDYGSTLNVGRHTIFVGGAEGIFVQSISQATNLVAKPSATLQIPPTSRYAVGHEALLSEAVTAVKARSLLEIVGAMGVGKSAFLRQLAHHPEVTTSHPDGILYFSQIEPIADVVQSIGRSFYQLYPESYLSLDEWQVALEDCQALILLNVPNARDESLVELMALLPQSTFVFTSLQSRVQTTSAPAISEREIKRLQLLPQSWEVIQPLVEKVLERSPGGSEQRLLEKLWQGFRGESVRLLQVSELLKLSDGMEQQWWDYLQQHPNCSTTQITKYLTKQLMQILDTPQRWILGLLTALDGVALSIEQIEQITGPQNPRPSLQRLRQLGLIQIVSQRYCVADHMCKALSRQFVSQPWMDRGVTVMLEWLESRSHNEIQEELPVILAFLRWAVQEKRSTEVLRLAQGIEPALVLSKRWEQWGRVLQWSLQAAWQLEDPAAEAWAWHEIGTRALLLDDITTAYDALQQSLKLRQQHSDDENPQMLRAIALTQNNLDRVIQGTLPTHKKAEVQAEESRRQSYGALLVISFVTFLLALSVGLVIRPWLTPSTAPASGRSSQTQ